MSEKRKKEKRAMRTPASPKITMHSALLHKGYFDRNNNWNSLVTISKFPGKIFRNRVEVLIFNHKGQVFLCREKNYFRVPGGSVERDVANHQQVVLEARQEARINIKNVKFSGIDYIRLFNKPFVAYDSSIYWDGVHNILYVADYSSEFDGYINKNLKDNHMSKYGRFYNVKDVYHYLKPEFQKAIDRRLEQKRKRIS
ncbi:MAG: NUDIX hydrolase [Candidatus Izemoplasmatales bacterium]|nr:NUDIX hydrolase [Candidatus Izemoplasmatales bacterium]